MNEKVKEKLKEKGVNVENFPNKVKEANMREALIHDKAVRDLQFEKIIENIPYEDKK